MCGIAGFWSARRVDGAEERLARMTCTLAHRGPDAQGVWHDPVHGVALGHRRLSIVDLSAEGAQPMRSASGRYQIVYNGEVYNTAELREALGAREWRGHSDTEVMLAAIDRWGLADALPRFAGMFAFALWDAHERALHLVRDRLGIKPLFYAHVPDGIVFGSELRAIRDFPGVDRSLDLEAVGDFLRFDYVPGPRSIYAGVRKLSPAHALTLRSPGERAEPVRWWDPVAVARDGAASAARTPAETADALEELLGRVVREHLMSDVPLGAFLSGGIDSSLVAALTRAASPSGLRTFSIGFDDAAFDESAHARAVAESLGTEHTELRVTAADALAVVPQLPSLYDEPFADSSQVPTYLLSALTRQHVTVSLSGDGGDELFAGYTRYRRNAELWQRVRRLPAPMRWGARRFARHVPEASLDRALTLVRAVLPVRLGRYASAERLRTAARVMGAESDRALYEQLFTHLDAATALGSAGPNGAARRVVGESWSAMPTHLQRMMQWDIATYLPDDILVKVDRASMAVGLEARVPLLDHRVAEFALRLPPDLATLGGVPKWPLREVLARHVPRALFERPKMGFGVPLGAWLRGPLREWMRDLLSPERVRRRGLVDAGVVERRMREHEAGSVEHGFGLWNLLMLEAWLEQQDRAAAVTR